MMRLITKLILYIKGNKEAALVSLVINLFSDSFVKKKSSGKNKIALNRIRKNLNKWALDYQNSHDGTVLVQGDFINYLDRNRIVDAFYMYVLEPEKQHMDEEVFINSMVGRSVIYLKHINKSLNIQDELAIREFYRELIKVLQKSLDCLEDSEIRMILYAVNQIRLGNREVYDVASENLAKTKSLEKKLSQIFAEAQKWREQSGPVLTDEWFLHQNQLAISNLGKRYLPELNVELELQKVFDIIGAGDPFFDEIEKAEKDLLFLMDRAKELTDSLQKIKDRMKQMMQSGHRMIGFGEACVELINLLAECETEAALYYQKLMEDKKRNIRRWLNREIDVIYQIENSAGEFRDFLEQKEIDMVEHPYMILVGEGGIGKSHLLADTVTKRNKRSERSILFLGQDFPAECVIWTRAEELLDLKWSMDIILDRIDQFAQMSGKRILLFLDAINEGGGILLWKDRLAGVLDRLSLYTWVGLVVSVRADFIDEIFDKTILERYRFTIVQHVGFGEMTNEAIRKYFDYYGIDATIMPYWSDEFYNPLFLRLFCEGCEKKPNKGMILNTEQIYDNYLDEINRRLSEKFNYSSSIQLVRKVMEQFVRKSYRPDIRNQLPKEDAVDLIAKVAKQYNVSSLFFDALISEGILTVRLDYNKTESVYITYERLADYIYAKSWMDSIMNHSKTDEEIIDYVDWPGVLEELIKLLAQQGVELFERFPMIREKYSVARAFVNSVVWRKDIGLKSKSTFEFINTFIVGQEDLLEDMLENMVHVSTNCEHPYNALFLHAYLLELPMHERDARFMGLFHRWNRENKSITRLIQWAYNESQNASEDTIFLASVMLSWMLICTDNLLRDRASGALCQMLRGHTDCLLRLLREFENVDDVYIMERLYAIAFGTITFEQDKEKLEMIAEYIYRVIFAEEKVFPDILIRDAARNIVLYVKRMGYAEKLDIERVKGPFHTSFPPVPEDSILEQYATQYDEKLDEKAFRAQRRIISSMQVDERSGWYGDFGRYVFQFYFREWQSLKPHDLMKIAIKDIFERGYDGKLHGAFDSDINTYSRIEERKIERIGKKYQWQSLYKLAAQVSDNYMRRNEAKDIEEYNVGAFEPNLRDFDPTINRKDMSGRYGVLQPVIYDSFIADVDEWLMNTDDIPDFHKLVETSVREMPYLMMNGMYTWEEKKLPNAESSSYEEMWFMIHAYLVREQDFETCKELLSTQNFWGRWMPEAADNYMIYNREYYWSDTFEFYDNAYYGGEEWKRVWRSDNEDICEIDFLVPVYSYMVTGEKEMPELPYRGWNKPCKTFFEGMKMQYQEENTALYNADGKLLCFDTIELFGEDRGFYIHRETLEEFLLKNHYRVIYSILGEKRQMNDSYMLHGEHKSAEYSGFYYLENGRIEGELRKET